MADETADAILGFPETTEKTCIMAELKPLILLVATVRSGTTMTAACFNQHDDIAVIREQRMLWTDGNQDIGHDRFTEEQVTPKIAKKLRKAFLDLQEEKGGARIFEKTPSNCLRVPFIHKIFPEALIIHMVRNGRDNVSSCLPFWTRPRKQRRIIRRIKETPFYQWPGLFPKLIRDQVGVRMGLTKRVRSWGVTYPGMTEDLQNLKLVEVIATQWKTAIETASADLERCMGKGNYLEWKYEELCERPQEHFQQALDMAGIPMTDHLHQYLADNIHVQAVDAWKKRLTAGQVRTIDPIIKPAMDLLGYSQDEIDESVSDDAKLVDA